MASVFGCLKPDGRVFYVVCSDAIGLESAYSIYIGPELPNERDMYTRTREMLLASEVSEEAFECGIRQCKREDYFLETSFIEDDSACRILLMLDGDILYQRWGLPYSLRIKIEDVLIV